MRRRLPARRPLVGSIVATCLLAALACSRQAPPPSAQEIAKGQHLARPFASPGRCFGKPSKCVSDGQCAPPFSLCQEGACCSGTIDPVTCACTCGGAAACGPRELCCDLPDGRGAETAASGGGSAKAGLRCRPVRECFGEG